AVSAKLGGLAGDTLIYGLGNGFHRLAPQEFGVIALLTVFGLVSRDFADSVWGFRRGLFTSAQVKTVRETTSPKRRSSLH
ncbi:MAG: hypothetical protein O3A21_02175, partial [Proteobacteria bacterium]|nr:hypothetical protein [Pseudomonadota bacterium]